MSKMSAVAIVINIVRKLVTYTSLFLLLSSCSNKAVVGVSGRHRPHLIEDLYEVSGTPTHLNYIC